MAKRSKIMANDLSLDKGFSFDSFYFFLLTDRICSANIVRISDKTYKIV